MVHPHRLAIALLCVAATSLTLLPLATRDLWAPDEPRYAAVSREMYVGGQFLVPHLNGEIYAEKPPLFFWIAAGAEALGFGGAATRVVTACFALGTLLLTWNLARLWLPPRVALLGTACLATSGLFAWFSQAGVLDVPLTFLTTLAAYGWFRWKMRGGHAIVLFYFGIGLAVLVKGPVGAVIPLLAAAAGRGLGGGRGPGRTWHALWGPVLAGGIVAAWLIPACLMEGKEFTSVILFKQNLGRAVASWSHAQPVWYYIPRLVAGFFPWIFLAPFALAWAWRKRDTLRDVRVLSLWFVLGLLFFTALSGKRERYLLPLAPALAVVVAAYIDSFHAAVRRRWARRAALAQHSLLGVVGIAFVLLAAAGVTLVDLRPETPSEIVAASRDLLTVQGRASLALAGGILLVLAHAGWQAVRSVALRRSAWISVMEVGAFFLAFDLLFMPCLNELKSPRDVAEKLERHMSRSGELALFGGNFSGAYNFYTGRLHIPILRDGRSVEEFLAGKGERIVLVSSEDYEGALGNELLHHARVIDRERVGRDLLLFLADVDSPLASGG